MQGDRCLEVLKLLGERIRQSTQATAVHPQRVILFFNVTCGNQINNRCAHNRDTFNVDYFWRGISALFLNVALAERFDN